MFCEKKKSKCPKKNFQSVKRGEKCLSVKFRVFGKKMEIERKVPERKKIKVFLGENLECGILLSSYSLVGVYINLQV